MSSTQALNSWLCRLCSRYWDPEINSPALRSSRYRELLEGPSCKHKSTSLLLLPIAFICSFLPLFLSSFIHSTDIHLVPTFLPLFLLSFIHSTGIRLIPLSPARHAGAGDMLTSQRIFPLATSFSSSTHRIP
jgi:hypothetical protein